jgi:hypothetical protein
VGSVCLEAGGNCSVGHAVRSSCCSEFRVALSFIANSTSPSSPPTSMVARLEVLSLQVHCGWVTERTFSWIDQNRRMSKDYEKLCASGEAFSYMLP